MFAGLFPLERVLEAENISKKWGATYVTVITNFIPRSIWPEKPPPGGVVFTNEYASGFYDQYSHFATGLIPEAIINFGHVGGIIFGFVKLLVILTFMSAIHLNYFFKKQQTHMTIPKVINLVVFVLVIYSVGNLLVSEVTSLMIGLIIKIVIIFIVGKLLTLTLPGKRFRQ